MTPFANRRVAAWNSGEVMSSQGRPEQVRNDPAVVAAYLGTDERAIARSDTRPLVKAGAAVAPPPRATDAPPRRRPASRSAVRVPTAPDAEVPTP